MVYRIRYRETPGSREAETTVEATSPTEAIVKFRHVRGEPRSDAMRWEAVTSVAPEGAEVLDGGQSG